MQDQLCKKVLALTVLARSSDEERPHVRCHRDEKAHSTMPSNKAASDNGECEATPLLGNVDGSATLPAPVPAAEPVASAVAEDSPSAVDVAVLLKREECSE